MTKATNNYCTVYIARHGESEGNVNHIIQGHIDLPLTPTGEQQAKNLANHLNGIKFDAIFSSDLLRARRTAEIIALDRQLQVKTAQALRERNFGHAEGKADAEFEHKFRDLIKKREQLSYQARFKLKLAPNIESDEELMSRFITYLREIATAYLGKTVLVIAHSGPIRTLLIHIGFGTYAQLHHSAVGNAAYIKLASDGVDFFIKETFGIHKLETK